MASSYPSLQERIDVSGKLVVFSRHHTARIMGVQFNPHITECVHHRGMMGMRFSKKGHPRHEGECFLEVLETKFSDQSVVSFCPHESAYLRPMYTKKAEAHALILGLCDLLTYANPPSASPASEDASCEGTSVAPVSTNISNSLIFSACRMWPLRSNQHFRCIVE